MLVKEVVRNGCLFFYMLLHIKMLYSSLLYAQTYRCIVLPTLNAL
jgi:hypothetical protein